MKIKEFNIKKGSIMPLGVTKVDGGVNFSVSVPNVDKVELNIYAKGSKDLVASITLDEQYRVGSVFSVRLDNFEYKQYEYTYKVMNKEFIDLYATKINGRDIWAKPLSTDEKKLVRGGFSFDRFNWGKDVRLNIPYSDSIMYRAHVRGLTCGKNSKVKNKGTYLGVIEKIPYFKELGITTLVLAPICEFNEILIDKYTVIPERPVYMSYEELTAKQKEDSDDPVFEHYMYSSKYRDVVPYKVNYWGYSDECQYMAPKASYALNPNKVVNEVKEMIRELHKAGIEVVLEFFFAENTNRQLIIDCLRYWLLEYHVDGFKINNNVAPPVMIATDAILCDTKIITESWKLDAIYSKEFKPKNKALAEMNEGFSNDIRRFLKGDEDQLGNFVYRFKRNDEKNAVINAITCHNGFTLHDVYAYDVKHNEANGEHNRDGNNYNYSWNCGIEGITRKTKVLSLRKKMMKNAFVTMLLSSGTPMILSGDEICHTQEGNNNAYCQDNDISWINWSMTKNKKEIFDFVKKVIDIRKNHPVLHQDSEFKLMDYIACGYPDMSYHGTKAWYPDFSNYSRVLGILISGDYAVPFPEDLNSSNVQDRYKKTRKQKDSYFYLAYNMHWEKHEYELPRLPMGYEWRVIIDTSKDDTNNKAVDKILTVDDRSIVVLESYRLEDTNSSNIEETHNKVISSKCTKNTKVSKK